MKMPRLVAGVPAAAGSGAAWRSAAAGGHGGAVVPQGCSTLKKVTCGGAFLACGASCLLGPEICVPCLAAVGATDCLNCLLDW